MDDPEKVEWLAEKYFKKENLPPQPELPVNRHWLDIQKCISDKPVTIVVGSTGCGKTTQIPQLLLESELYQNRRPCRIIVTQPRKIAAISVAHTVCGDRRWEVGTICGYQVGMDREITEDTCIQYVTTNILVERIIHTKSVDLYTHIIVDEIHERHQDLDCLLYLLKTFAQKNKSLKIILMSATAESSLYAEYMGQENCNRISIEGSMYSTKKYYLEDLPPRICNRIMSYVSGKNFTQTRNVALKNKTLILHVDVMKAVAELIETFDQTDAGADRGAVLIFMPGIAEIGQMIRVLSNFKDRCHYELVPLHSKVPLEEQNRAFKRFSRRFRKIIVATNIAESSITVPDIKYVIDFCLTKCQVMDKNTAFASYQIESCSQASSEQRAGRAGRVRNGIVYRLVSRAEYEGFHEYTTPEILRSPVDISVLKVKKFGLEKPKEVLKQFISPPDPEDVKKAIITLKEVQAMQLEHKGKVDTEDGDLTIIGRVMASLPLDIRLSKLILMGFAFGCFEECVKMAACLSVDDILFPDDDYMVGYKEKMKWSRGNFSDPLMLMHAFDAYLTKKEQTSRFDEFQVMRNWAFEKKLQLRRLVEAYHVYEELKVRLQQIGFRQPHTPNLAPRDPSLQNFCIMLALCGAFYPYYFFQEPIDFSNIKSCLDDHNPINTMVISGLPDRHAPLYAQAIRSILKDCIEGDLKITFKGMDAYLSFTDSQANGSVSGGSEIPLSAYFCEMFQRKHKAISVPKIPEDVAEKLLRELNISTPKDQISSTVTVLPVSSNVAYNLRSQPLPSDKNFRGEVSWFVDIVSLYVTLDERKQSFIDLQNEISLSEGSLEPVKNPQIGQIVLAYFEDQLFRARLIKAESQPTDSSWRTRGKSIPVFFIDYGNIEFVSEVFEMHASMLLSNSEAPFAYKCQLAHLQSPDGQIRPPTKTQNQSVGKQCRVDVFSIVDEVLRIELFVEDDDEEFSVNEKLIRDKHLIRIEELDFSQDKKPEYAIECIQNLVVRGEAYIDTNHYSIDKLSLNGPRSPLSQLMELKSLNKKVTYKNIELVSSGVNHIMFGETGPHRRFLVAHAAKMSGDLKRLQLLRTTVMPKLPMMLPFVALVFAPRAEYRCNKDQTKYIGAICGMGGIEKVPAEQEGADPEDLIQPLFPQSDLEIPFSQEMGKRDVNIINEIRRLLNEAFCGNNEVFEWSSVPILKIQKKILDYTLMFFNEKNRKEIPHHRKEKPLSSAYKWGVIKPEDRIDDEAAKRQILYRPHSTARIRNEAMFQMLKLMASFMHQAKNVESTRMSMCVLCNMMFQSTKDAYNHIHDGKHKQKYAKLKGLNYDVHHMD